MKEENLKGPYSYTYRASAGPRDGVPTREMQETLFSIKDTLLLLTGGCEVAERREGLYCEKHGRPVQPGGRGCDYLSSHFSRGDSESRSKAQLQQYVNDILGIKNPDNVRRLTGT